MSNYLFILKKIPKNIPKINYAYVKVINNNHQLNHTTHPLNQLSHACINKNKQYVLPEITYSGMTVSYSNNLKCKNNTVIQSKALMYNQFFAPYGTNILTVPYKRIAMCISNFDLQESYWNVIIC